MTPTIDVLGTNHTPIRVLLILKQYNSPLPTDNLVEFYDTRYNHTQSGQFITRYNLNTLTDNQDSLRQHGLNLYASVKDWSLNPRTMSLILDWIAYQTYVS
jgi:hypothetical protein